MHPTTYVHIWTYRLNLLRLYKVEASALNQGRSKARTFRPSWMRFRSLGSQPVGPQPE